MTNDKVKSEQYDYSLLNKVGEDVFISKFVEIRRPHLVSVGNHVAIDSGVYITTQADLGDYVHLAPYITVIGGAKSKLMVGHFATIAAGCRIIAGSDTFAGDGFTSVTVPDRYRDVVNHSIVEIRRFAGIGTNAVIMPGVTVSEGTVIGACSLVTHNTEPWTIYMGIPARPVKTRRNDKMLAFAKELGYL
jgi:galactoside O-acetyltransferase